MRSERAAAFSVKAANGDAMGYVHDGETWNGVPRIGTVWKQWGHAFTTPGDVLKINDRGQVLGTGVAGPYTSPMVHRPSPCCRWS